MSKHEYIGNQYIVSNLRDYCCSHLVRATGYNFRDVEQKGNNLLFKLGNIKCKITLKGMVKNNNKHYYSQLEFSIEDSKIPSKIRNSLLVIQRSKTGRISGNQSRIYEEYLKNICSFSKEYSMSLNRENSLKSLNRK